MNGHDEFSTAELNAFVDGRLPVDRVRQLQEAMAADPELAAQLQRLQTINALAAQSYRHVPVPEAPPDFVQPETPAWLSLAAILALALIGGGIVGWMINQHNSPAAPAMQTLANFQPQQSDATKILLHISTAAPERVNAALDAAEEILADSRERGKNTRLEIVANAEGLAMLREGSPYARRIQRMIEQYESISFKACGIAMETANLKEGIEVKLLPEAERVDAALDQILTRLRQGWTYIRA